MAAASRNLVVVSSRNGVRDAGLAFDAFAAAIRLPADAGWRLRLALDEILSNVVRHARAKDARPEQIELEFRLEGEVLQLTIVDEGMAFDPLAWPEPDTTLPAEQRKEGGLGIFLVRKLMDDVAYERRGGRNRLVCRKRVQILGA